MAKEVDIATLSESQQVNLVNNRWRDSSSLWEKLVEGTFKANSRIWQNNPEWLNRVPQNRSRARDNRTFLAMESVINTLTGNPSKPNVIPAKDNDEATAIADNLQDFILAKYRDLGMKTKFRRGLRYLFLSRLVVFKVFWNPETDDFDVLPMDPRNVRFSKKSTSMYDTEFAIELVPDIPITKLIERFPKKKKTILRKIGYNEERLLVDNPTGEYKEAWIGEYVLYEFMGSILHVEKHPYWDWEGIGKLTNHDLKTLSDTSGIKRRGVTKALEKKAEGRKEKGGNYQNYLYNHFDRPLPPYIFGSVLGVETQPVGETSLIEQVEPLQMEVDKRKRQISDNAELMNGKWKVDTSIVEMSRSDAQRMTTNPRGIIYGKGVRLGVDIVTGKELPSFVKDDLLHSVAEIDNIFGTQPTFRGEGGADETATGRAILREQSFSRLDELIDLVDTLHHHLYAWWHQMMKARYSETHYVKPIGSAKAREVIELTRDDLEEGIEIQIIPGQVMPEDRLFQAERAKEEAQAGLIDPLTYFEETQRDNPMKLAKRLEMYRINPFSIIKLDEEDMQAIMEAQELFGVPGEEGGGGEADPRAAGVARIRQEATERINSPEFQALSQAEQQKEIDTYKTRVEALAAGQNQ